ncbi:hypothetical protein [Piscinibacter sp.]|jgi:hypothetical protein|uniref:hypothetical protein n=1 Tax=Piscinibacter sp. TaxID=1903157 RepID=UPI00355AB444
MNHLSIHPARLALAVAAALPGFVFAVPTDSAYRTDVQDSHVEDATSQGINQVNMITCFMTAMRPDALVNKGDYIALVDKNKCDPNARSSSGNSGSNNAGSSAPSYMSAVVNSTRSSNTDPMRVKTWIDQSEKGFNATIYVNISASVAPSSTNPYGVFRLDYCGKGDVGPCMMKGYLDGNATGISYFEIESGGGGGGGGGTNTTALRLTTSGADSGAGALQMSQMGQQIAYDFAYNDTYFRRSDGVSDQCFSRLADDPETAMSVWRYGLYDAVSGDRVNRSSGFPIEYTASNGTAYNGQMGYYGLWLPSEVSGQVANGATVQRVEYAPNQPPTKTPYTLVKADGRLTKYTKRSRTLASTDKIKFNVFVWDATGLYAGAVGNRQYEMYWDDSAGTFKVTGVIECGNSGCQTKDLDAEQSVPASYFASQGGARGWSQSLGGELFIPLAGVTGSVDSASVNVIYREQELVYPANMPATLYCLRECPTATTLASYFAPNSTDPSPFVASTFNNWGPTGDAGVVSYTTDATLAMLNGAGGAVAFTDSSALQSRPQYQWGVRTGRLFTTKSAAQCDPSDATKFCDSKVDELDTYYQWETGPNQWNQFAAVKDSAGAIVEFDAPLQVSYGVPADAQKYGAYAGKAIVLQYGGFGELWGIPGQCVSSLTNDKVSCDTPNSRYVPSFVIPFDEVLGRVNNGSTTYLSKWLDREIRFARKDPSMCSNAGVTLGSALTLPGVSGLNDPSDSASDIYIGSKPVVTDAPRVIHGDVKY